jgi:hypothetical protein
MKEEATSPAVARVRPSRVMSGGRARAAGQEPDLGIVGVVYRAGRSRLPADAGFFDAGTSLRRCTIDGTNRAPRRRAVSDAIRPGERGRFPTDRRVLSPNDSRTELLRPRCAFVRLASSRRSYPAPPSDFPRLAGRSPKLRRRFPRTDERSCLKGPGRLRPGRSCNPPRLIQGYAPRQSKGDTFLFSRGERSRNGSVCRIAELWKRRYNSGIPPDDLIAGDNLRANWSTR